jgi:hypothetical protein
MRFLKLQIIPIYSIHPNDGVEVRKVANLVWPFGDNGSVAETAFRKLRYSLGGYSSFPRSANRYTHFFYSNLISSNFECLLHHGRGLAVLTDRQEQGGARHRLGNNPSSRFMTVMCTCRAKTCYMLCA